MGDSKKTKMFVRRSLLLVSARCVAMIVMATGVVHVVESARNEKIGRILRFRRNGLRLETV